MPKYQEKSRTGTEWVQPARVIIEGLSRGGLSVLFVEERVQDDGVTQTFETAGIVGSTYALTDNILMVNPNTGVPNGNDVNVKKLHDILHSLYWRELRAAGRVV